MNRVRRSFAAIAWSMAFAVPAATTNLSNSTSDAAAVNLSPDMPCGYRQLLAFGKPGPGATPQAGLLLGSDGKLYGTAWEGGANNFGTIFSLNRDGTGFKTIFAFEGRSTGAAPNARLIQGSDGALYGTATAGGSHDLGTVFKISPDGTGFTVLEDFDGVSSGGYPQAGLTQGRDGVLYGITAVGGLLDFGTIFRINVDGTGFTVLRSLDGAASGSNPWGGLIQGADGALYGTAAAGGRHNVGTVFKLNTDGSGFSVLTDFTGFTASYPYGALMQGHDGRLYGTSYFGGSINGGTVFVLSPDGTGFAELVSFDPWVTGAYPIAGLIQGLDGALYGTTYWGGHGGGTVFRVNTDGTGLTAIAAFDSVKTGYGPYAGVVQASDGTLYGSTPRGANGYGALFALEPDGSAFRPLFDAFSSIPDLHESGGFPAAVIQGIDGALYGTTTEGGASEGGTVFRMNLDGSGLRTLKYLGDAASGRIPTSKLVQAADGVLYGTAEIGGPSGAGTAFRISPDGSGFTVLKSFDGSISGAGPGELVVGLDGALYGTTYSGGTAGFGTVFKLSTDGSAFTVLRSLNRTSDGSVPGSHLTQGSDGALYGVASQGGSQGHGTAFKLNPDGTGFTVLVNFDVLTTGGGPVAGLTMGLDGALYGLTSSGGQQGSGTVFKLSTDGFAFAVIASFDGTTGYGPGGALLQGSDGALYGTTDYGSPGGYGTLFTLNRDGSSFVPLLGFDLLGTGVGPNALIQGEDGLLYGPVHEGGSTGGGAVYRFDPFVDRSPPQARCTNATVAANVTCVASASVDAGSSDPDAGDRLTLTQDPPGPYPVGDTLVTLTVTDRGCLSSTCTATVIVPAGSSCDDGNACTQHDSCQLGSGCVGSDPVMCSPIDQCHDIGACDPSTGECSNPPKPDGTTCNDGNACRTKDACEGGVCMGGPPLNCDDGNCCTVDSCAPATGCMHAPYAVPPTIVAQPSLDGGGGSCPSLWPPSHGYVDFTVADTGIQAQAVCGGLTYRFASCASSQPEDQAGGGDGQTLRDCVYEPAALHLRAERDATCSPNGRTYAMTMIVTDACGNSTISRPFTVCVWQDKEHGPDPSLGRIYSAVPGANQNDTRQGTNGTYGTTCATGR